MNFDIGDKVICIDDRPKHGIPCPLVKGAEYTISEIFTVGPIVGVCVAEEPDEFTAFRYGIWVIYYGFLPQRFRKVQPRSMEDWLSAESDYDECIKNPAPIREDA